jgi:hypothetical protein
MEPIQDDIETIRESEIQYHPAALAALDRLVAERDRLIQENEELKKDPRQGA